MHSILLIPTSNPPLVGIYKDNSLVDRLELDLKLSDSLVPLFCKLDERGIEFDSLYYVRGPGSYTALKLAYIFSQTLNISKDVKIYAANGFYFNNNSPIKAYGNNYFVCEDGHIITKVFHEDPNIEEYTLPEILDTSIFSEDLEPLYILPAV